VTFCHLNINSLICRCANFMSTFVWLVVMNWSILQPEMVYYFQRMASPTGRNAQWCCDTVGLSLYNMHDINKDLVFRRVYSSLPDWVVNSVSTVHELLQVHCNRMCLHCWAHRSWILLLMPYVLVRCSYIYFYSLFHVYFFVWFQ